MGVMVQNSRVYTVEEFEVIAEQPDNEDRLLELVDGEIVEKVPTELHSIVSGNIFSELREFVKLRNLGRVVFEVRYRVPGDETNSRIPDVSFTRAERLLPVVEKGAVPQLPDLCVEVQSPNDTPKKMRDKAAYYLENGAQLVWLVYPKKRMIEVQYPDGEFDIFTAGETLTGGDVLPGFTMLVSKAFET
jgi:Uma2 family endonuclease